MGSGRTDSLSRRGLLKGALRLAAGAVATPYLLALLPRAADAMGPQSAICPALLRHEGNWDVRPNALETVLAEVNARTSILVATRPATVDPGSEDIFRYPLLWMTGDRGFPRFPDADTENLRKHLMFGGTLIVDDATGLADSAFASAAALQLGLILPHAELRPLSPEHPAYMAYYAVGRVSGRVMVSPRLEAVILDGRAAVILCRNDLLGALERTEGGGWMFSLPGAEQENRILAARLAVNLVVYALSLDYKVDQVHNAYRLSHPQAYPTFRPGEDEPAAPAAR